MIETLPVSADGIVDIERLGEAIDAAPDLVTLMAVNNEVGTIQPFAEIGRMCMAADVTFHTDATQALGRIPINVEADRITMASMSAHKIYGPQGVGAFYCVDHLRHTLRRTITGGGQEDGHRSDCAGRRLWRGLRDREDEHGRRRGEADDPS